jgi:hypothetical protein
VRNASRLNQDEEAAASIGIDVMLVIVGMLRNLKRTLLGDVKND